MAERERQRDGVWVTVTEREEGVYKSKCCIIALKFRQHRNKGYLLVQKILFFLYLFVSIFIFFF